MDLHEKPLSKGVKFDTKIYENTKHSGVQTNREASR